MISSVAKWSLFLLALFVWPGLRLWVLIIFLIGGRGSPPLNDVTEKLESISREITRLSPILDLRTSKTRPGIQSRLGPSSKMPFELLCRTVYWGTLRDCSHLRIISTSTFTGAERLLDDGVCAVSTSLSEPLAVVRPDGFCST
jgi:hypothetical protein